ncbi:MAG: tRNA (adenosine(37)-N6)-threonylcarbamoyltransferase complex dimerization subunit type 1 TsaB [Chloroflexi bacterium]|nr:tRNA (adenosine(37)-N6)-threonylcarbamoyltransferase complex dimerization subunit type 1 TsaB [Chloroflexota bacterium]
MLLAVDTSTALASVALYDGTLRAETTWLAGRRHTEQVLPTAAALLELVGVGPEALRAVAVAIGPGSYTGLRVGLALAKGLATARRLSIIGVETLEIVAAPWAACGRPVRAVVDAGRRRYATALYDCADGVLVSREPARGVSLAELVAAVRPPMLVVGELDAGAREALGRVAGVTVASPTAGVRRAGVLAELAWERWRRGEGADPAVIAPLYIGEQAQRDAGARRERA